LKLDKKSIILIFLWTSVSLAIATDAVWRFSNEGSVNQQGSVAAYTDPECTVPLTVIHWGMLELDNPTNYILYVKNTGVKSITVAFTLENFVPAAAETELDVSFDYAGQVLVSNQVLPVHMTVTVHADSSLTTFNFDVVLQANTV